MFLNGMIFSEILYGVNDSSQISIHIVLVITLARFICGSILHLSLLEEVDGGLCYMKYALNHPYKFQSSNVAF